MCRTFPFHEKAVSMTEACRRKAGGLFCVPFPCTEKLIYSHFSGLDFPLTQHLQWCVYFPGSLLHEKSPVSRTELCILLGLAVIMTDVPPVYVKEWQSFTIRVCLKQNPNSGNRGVLQFTIQPLQKVLNIPRAPHWRVKKKKRVKLLIPSPIWKSSGRRFKALRMTFLWEIRKRKPQKDQVSVRNVWMLRNTAGPNEANGVSQCTRGRKCTAAGRHLKSEKAQRGSIKDATLHALY